LEAIERYRELGQTIPDGLNSLASLSLSRHCIGTPLAQNVNVERMALTSDGNWLLTSCTDGTLRLWDIAHYKSNSGGYILDRVDSPFVSLLFSPDSRWAVAGTADGIIFIWDMTQTSPASHRIEIAERFVGLRGMAMSPDGQKLVAYCGQLNKTIAVQQIVVPPNTAFNVPANSMYGMPIDSGIVWVWEMEQLVKGEQRPIPLRGHERGVTSVAISRDSKLLVTGSEDCTVRVFDLQSQTPGVAQMVFKGHEAEVTCVTIAPDNSWVASGDRGNVVRIWNLPQKNMNNGNQYAGKFALTDHNGWISAVTASPDGRWLVSAGYDRSVRMWNMTSYDGTKAPEQGPVLETQNAAVLSVRFNLKGNKLVTHCGDSSIRIWDVSEYWGQPGALIESHSIKSVLLQDKQMEINDYQLTDDDLWLVMACNKPYNTNESGILLWPISPENIRNMANEYTKTVFGNTEIRK
jgi:WD40 repeat protein